jgi:spoIIIJ-associated protein
LIKEAVGTGDTVEEAFSQACAKLGIAPEKAKQQIIKMPEKKKLGLFGGSPAEVKAVYEVSPADTAKEYLLNILGKMGLTNLSIETEELEDSEGTKYANLTLSGDDVGFIIGHRGETLDSLQYLASLVSNHDEEKYYRITLDVGSFREKRKETLESLGKKMAVKAVRTGRNSSLEPMNPYERRIIHTAVQTVEGAKSWSEGENLARHVVIGPIDGEKYHSRPRFDNRRNGQRRDQGMGRNNYKQRSGDRRPFEESKQHASFIEDLKKQSQINDPNAPKKAEDVPLYGRIDPNK